MFRKRLDLSEVKKPDKYQVKETGAFCCYTILEEYQNLQFLIKAHRLNIKSEVKVCFYTSIDKNSVATINISFNELGQHIANELIIGLEITESEFAIILLASELWVYSFDKDLAETICHSLWGE